MTITLKQGNLNVVTTGSILITNNEDTQITLDENYTIIIKYVDDAEEKEQAIKAKTIDHGVCLELKNFNRPLGTTTTSPFQIAERNDDHTKIYLSICVEAKGSAKMMTFGIYEGKEDSGDESKQ